MTLASLSMSQTTAAPLIRLLCVPSNSKSNCLLCLEKDKSSATAGSGRWQFFTSHRRDELVPVQLNLSHRVSAYKSLLTQSGKCKN